MTQNHPILLIDGNEDAIRIYRSALAQAEHDFPEIVHVQTYQSARFFLQTHTPMCCIIDYQFPGGSARNLIEEISIHQPNDLFPVVISVNAGQERDVLGLMQTGAQDYLIKDSLTGPELAHTLKNAIKTFGLQQKLVNMAHYDALTGLLNRSLFLDRLEQAVEEAKRYNRSLCLISLDIDYFKQINDTYGHEAGDKILRSVATRMQECVRSSDSIARLGGDEFMVLLPNTASHTGHYVAQKILSKLPHPINVDGVELYVSTSMGLANFPDTAHSHHELIKQVDAALYKAKEKGRSQYVKFSQQNRSQWRRKNDLAEALPEAIKNDEIELFYQPIYVTGTDICHSVEALVRWEYQGASIPVEDIVPLIHQGAMSIPFHKWLYARALQQLKAWQQSVPELKIALNMPTNLCHSQLVIDHLFEAIKKYDVRAGDIILELNEAHLMQHAELTKEVLNELSNQGIIIAIDDFGKGNSSIEYLASLPCKQLKIDQSFLLDWDNNPSNQKIVAAITALGKQLGLQIVAEGVESRQLSNTISAIGCELSQGFSLGAPTKPCIDWQTYIEATKQDISSQHLYIKNI